MAKNPHIKTYSLAEALRMAADWAEDALSIEFDERQLKEFLLRVLMVSKGEKRRIFIHSMELHHAAPRYINVASLDTFTRALDGLHNEMVLAGPTESELHLRFSTGVVSEDSGLTFVSIEPKKEKEQVS